MCLAIPGQIVEVVDESNQLARVDVAGVRRTVNIGLFDDIGPGDWVLIHVGFAISVIDEEEARATRELLEAMGAEYEQELHELAGERDRVSCERRATASPAATTACRCGCCASATTRSRCARTPAGAHHTVELALVDAGTG